MRAGQVTTGQEACIIAVRKQTEEIVLMDEATSLNGQKKMTAVCKSYGVPLGKLPRDAVGLAVGKNNRMVVSLRRGPLAQKLLKKAQEEKILLSWDEDDANSLMGGLKIDE